MSIYDIGERISKLRKAKGLTQKQLAKQLNISSQLISKWENNQAIPSLEYTIELSNFFGVTIDNLINDYTQNEQQESIRKSKIVFKDTNFFKKATSKPAVISYILIASVLFIVGIVLLTIFTFIPSANKDSYLNHINSSIENRIVQDNYFNLEITSKQNNNITDTKYFKGFVNENGVTYKAYNSGVTIVDNVEYNSLYKQKHQTEITTTIELFEHALSSITDIDLILNKEDICYLRKIKEGYFIKLDKKALTQNMSTSVLENINFKSDYQGTIYIENDKFIKMELSIKFVNKLNKKDYTITSSLELKQEKPNIVAPTDTPWRIDLFYTDNEVFFNSLYKDKQITNSTITNQNKKLLEYGLTNDRYIIFNNKIYILYSYYYNIESVNVFDLETLNFINSVSLSSYECDIDNLIKLNDGILFYDDNNIYNLRFEDLSVQNIFTKTHSYKIELIHSYNEYIAYYIKYPNSYENHYFIYNTKTKECKTHLASENFINHYIKDNLVYSVGDKPSYYDSIRKIDITNAEECYYVAQENYIDKICYITDNEEIFYYIDTQETSDSAGIKKIGSDFKYNYGQALEVKENKIYIYYNEYIYVYQNEVLLETIILQNTEEDAEENILDNKNIIYIDNDNNIFISGSEKIYHSNYENYTDIDNLYCPPGNELSPKIVWTNETYLVVAYEFMLYDFVALGFFDKTDLSKPIAVTEISHDLKYRDVAYSFIDINNSILWIINNDIYLVKN